jgi:hypothetical protein
VNGYLAVTRAVAVPTPDEIAAWLRHEGWTLVSSDDAWAVFEVDRDGERFGVEVPQRSAALDYPRAVATLVRDLADLEGRTEDSLLRDIRGSAVDLLRIAIEGPATREGRLPVEAGRRVFGAARDLLLAAACSVLDPRPAYATRKADRAMEVVERARFGQSDIGSFVVTLETVVPPRLDPPLIDDGDPDSPLERRTMVHLARAVAAAHLATRQSAASGTLHPFKERTVDGVSANLCDALAELLQAAAADALRTTVSFAHRRPVAVEVPRSVVFSADMAPTLRSAASGLREVAALVGQEVVGTVVLLESEDAAVGGAVQLRAVVDGRMLRVRVHLPSDAYAVAVEAHKTGSLVRCVGELTREGRGRVLRNPREFALCADEEEGA